MTLTKQTIYDFLQYDIGFQQRNKVKLYNTFKEIVENINATYDVNISYETWKKRRQRDTIFYNLTAQLLAFDPAYVTTIGEPIIEAVIKQNKSDISDSLIKLAENSNSKTVKFSGNTFETLSTDDIIEKVKQSYKSTSKLIKLNYLTIEHYGPICIVALGDTHIGKGLNIEKLLADLEIIANTDGMYVLLMGDYADNFVNGSWCMNMALIEGITPREQNALTDHIIGKIAHKVIGLLTGNHNEWSTVGDWNPLMNILEKYNYTGFYGTNRLDIELNYISGINENVYKIRMMHNWPGRSITNPTYGIEKACKTDSFDIGIAAHTHEGALYREFAHENTKRVAVKVGSYKLDDYAYNLGYSQFGMLQGEAAVPIIIMPNGRIGTAPNLELAAQLLKV